MDEKEYDLVMKDLCGRLPYGVKANVAGWDEEKQEEVNIPLRVYSIDTDGYLRFDDNDYDVNYYGIEHCTLFLRPLSSMTNEEKHECQDILGGNVEISDDFIVIIDSSIKSLSYLELEALFSWLNKKMFDYRGLISKGLALEAPEGMYNN